MKIAIVSIYPEKGLKHAKTGGVASYTHNLAQSLRKNNEIHIFCDKKNGDGASEYIDNGVYVHRIFEKNIFYFKKIIHALKGGEYDAIHVQQELGLYGGVINASLLFIIFLFSSSPNKVITLHGVVSKKEITKEFTKENNSKMPCWAIKLAFKLIFRPLVFFSDKQIVHEEKFKNIVVKEYGGSTKNVIVIPHGIEAVERINKSKAKDKLNIPQNTKIVLFMGYLTGYKGIDLLIEGFAEYVKNYDKKCMLLICSGKHPKLASDENYLKNSYNRLKQKASKYIPRSNFRWIGFIKEEEIALYYSSADISCYPYTIAMSSSGPMALSIAYKIPFIASDVFNNVLDEREIIFSRNAKSFASVLNNNLSNINKRSKNISELLKQRLWGEVAIKHQKVYLQGTAKNE